MHRFLIEIHLINIYLLIVSFVIQYRAMSKRKLLEFLEGLNQNELQEQLVELYTRFKNVKEFYDFSFNPNEGKRLADAKIRITKEYFPEAGKKVKKRRSVAQKIIQHLKQLEADPEMIIDVMLYNLEVAQLYTAEHPLKQEAFYKSMLRSFQEALEFVVLNYSSEYTNERINRIIENAHQQDWMNKEGFALAKKSILLNQ